MRHFYFIASTILFSQILNRHKGIYRPFGLNSLAFTHLLPRRRCPVSPVRRELRGVAAVRGAEGGEGGGGVGGGGGRGRGVGLSGRRGVRAGSRVSRRVGVRLGVGANQRQKRQIDCRRQGQPPPPAEVGKLERNYEIVKCS